MVRTTETDSQAVRPIMDFYDHLAPDYDVMTGFDMRFVREKPFFRLLVERHNIGTAVDAGCGTGFHALLLAQLGVAVTAVDVSREMLKRLTRHAKNMGAAIVTVESSFQDLHRSLHTQFDAVFSLGNSLAHLLTEDDLRLALQNFAALLKPRGTLFLQNLNYDRILAKLERVQSAKEQDGVTFVRFYDYREDGIRFNILTLKKAAGEIEHDLQSIDLRPVRRDEIVVLLADVGFDEIKSYGGISMEDYHADSSRDLVILATKRT